MRPAPSPTSPPVIAWRELMEAHERVMSRLRPALREHGLSVTEFDVLVNLEPAHDARHSELADRVVLSRTALTRLVDRLVDRGLLLRGPDDRDGRGVRIALTADGARLRMQALAANDAVVESALSPLDRDALENLTSAVRAIAPRSS